MSPMQQERHILVLGASGKLGRMLRRFWRRSPPAGLTAHWQYREIPHGEGVLWRPGDPPPSGMPKIDAILALWGVTPGPGRDLAENSRLAIAAMELGAALGAERVLHCSSAAVYEPGPDPLDETRAGGAINAYGAAKLEMEAAVAGWVGAHPEGPGACSMRIANVVGADSLFAGIARGDGTITLDRFADDAGPWRSYVTIPALARVAGALVTCQAGDVPDIVNVALPGPYAMEALARAAGCRIDWCEAGPSAAPMVNLSTARLDRLIRLDHDRPEDIIAGWRVLEGDA